MSTLRPRGDNGGDVVGLQVERLEVLRDLNLPHLAKRVNVLNCQFDRSTVRKIFPRVAIVLNNKESSQICRRNVLFELYGYHVPLVSAVLIKAVHNDVKFVFLVAAFERRFKKVLSGAFA